MVENKRIQWDVVGQRKYHYGVSKGVLFQQNEDGTYAGGVAFNGLRTVSDSPDGGDVSKYYADNIEYFAIANKVNWKGSIGVYDTPDEFDECVGEKELAPGLIMSQQPFKRFALCYREELGTDTAPKKGYVLHIIYGALASPSQQDHNTTNENTEPEELSYDFDCTTLTFKDKDGNEIETAHIKLSTLKDSIKEHITEIEDILYGKDPVEGETPSEGVAPRLLMPNEIADILNN